MSLFACNAALFPVSRHQEALPGNLDLFVMGMVKGLKLFEVQFLVAHSLQIIFAQVLRLFSIVCSWYFFFEAVFGVHFLLRPEKQAEIVLCSCGCCYID